MSVRISQAASAQSDQSAGLILRHQQHEVFLRDVFPFDRKTLCEFPDVVRICVLRAAWKLSAWRMTSCHLQGKGHQIPVAFREIQYVSRLEVAMIYATSLQAWFEGFPQLATI